MEAARRLGVSDKTVRRWIHAGKLSARFPQPNHCEIEISHLERFIPGHPSGQATNAVESRVTELEQRVLTLEQQIQRLMGKEQPLKLYRVPLKETIPSFDSSALCVLFHAAFKTFCRKSGKPLRPYMERFIYLSLLIFPSTGPFERTVNYT